MPRDDDRRLPQPLDPAPPPAAPTLTRRDLLKAGTLGTVGLAAAAGALTIPAWRRLGAQDSTAQLRDAAPDSAANAHMHASHDQMNAVGDLAPDSYNPTRFLADFDTGSISILPTGQTLREYEVVAEDRNIEVAPGVFFAAWTYNGQVPGPTLRCTEGDRIRVRFTNRGAHPHTIHFHGIHPANMDGSFEMVNPGATFIYEFDAEPFGLQLYHCHTVPLKRHIHKGLYGAFIIDPRGGRPPADEFVMVMNAFDTNFDADNEVYAVNTVANAYMQEPIQVTVGRPVRIYLINLTEFDLVNSLHLHGMFFDVFRTGTSMTPSERTDTLMLCQGERAIIETTFRYPGDFMFHAHQSEFAELGWMGHFRAVKRDT